uniref:Uncharacterized protein n=1 Tax=Arundo donax TaxID=35708 RepID=A0A0A9A6A6_ARUDO
MFLFKHLVMMNAQGTGHCQYIITHKEYYLVG